MEHHPTLKEAVHSSAKKMAASHGKAKEIEVRKADNNSGYITRTRFHNNSTSGAYQEPVEAVHGSLASVHKHLKQHFEDKMDANSHEE